MSSYDVYVSANKGGIGKTTNIIMLIACALMRNAQVSAFAIDRQDRLQHLYPGLVEQVGMPDTETLIDDDHAEGRALARVFHMLRSSPEKGLLFLDIGANYDERVAEAMLRANIGRKMADAGRRPCILIPLDAAADTIIGAASAAHRFKVALPEAGIVFVQRQKDLYIDVGPQSEITKAAKAYVEVIEPLRSEATTLVIGQMRTGVHKAFASVAKNPLDFLNCKPELLGAAAADRKADPLENEYAGEEILAYFEDFLGRVDEEAQRVLGFRNPPLDPPTT